MSCHIVAVSNIKGGVGKTTTTINLAQALAMQGQRILVVDLDPQGNATQGLGIDLNSIHHSVGDLLRSRELNAGSVIYQGDQIDLIPATPLLARIEKELVGTTNGELRLSRKLEAIRERYSIILIDTPPTLGTLMNSALNAADSVLVPVDSGFYAMMGIKELIAEMEEIRLGHNPKLKVLGYLQTLCDHTKIAKETWDGLVTAFGDEVFETQIRRNVKLKEAPALGRTIFHHDPTSPGAEDYWRLATEVRNRLGLSEESPSVDDGQYLPEADHSPIALGGGQ